MSILKYTSSVEAQQTLKEMQIKPTKALIICMRLDAINALWEVGRKIDELEEIVKGCL